MILPRRIKNRTASRGKESSFANRPDAINIIGTSKNRIKSNVAVARNEMATDVVDKKRDIKSTIISIFSTLSPFIW